MMHGLATGTRQHTIFRILNTIFRMRRDPAIPFSLHSIEAGGRSRGIDLK